MRKPLALLAVAATAAAAAVPAYAATRTVKVRDNSFGPSSLSAKKGDTIRFRWTGDNPHNVRAYKGPRKFNSGKPKRSGSYSKRFTVKGTYKILCDVHPGMRMTLRVR